MKVKTKCPACRVSSAADEAIRHPSKTSFNMCSILMLRALETKQKEREGEIELKICADHSKRFMDFLYMVKHKVNHAGRFKFLAI